MIQKNIYRGKVFHKRYSPKIHAFTYPAFFLIFSIKKLKDLETSFFSCNKFNLFSFYTSDHGLRDGSDLFTFARDILLKNSIETAIDDIHIQTLPRVLGYVFNPVSFWYLYDKNQHLIAKLAEVNNTFGETHTYLIPSDDKDYQKSMQVSPFNQIKGSYKFKFLNKQNSEFVSINYYVENEILLTAHIEGVRQEWSSANFIKLFLSFPFNTLLIVFRIHYHALKLYIKGIPFFGKNGVVNDRVS